VILGRWRRWVWPRVLREFGVLGINRRNSEFILARNRRERYPHVDDKRLTKRICEEAGIPVPKTYAIVERHGDVRRIQEIVAPFGSFVVKPARGAGGRGIAVVASHETESYVGPSGSVTTLAELRYHLSTILSGLYSLANRPDCAIIEQRLVCHPAFQRVAVEGTPDVRVILYRGVPAMAMIRLPTRISQGRANLHQGAIAAGVDVLTGRTLGGVWFNQAITRHPDTGEPITGFDVPFWAEILFASMRLADALGLGYIGADFVVDAELGPVVLEANARPGLSIQIANQEGLRPRLHYIDAQPDERRLLEHRLDVVVELSEGVHRGAWQSGDGVKGVDDRVIDEDRDAASG
jgi:alpha-L-glutamate ligase-like protein